MAIRLDAWLPLIRREYLQTFIPAGGGATRFVVAADDVMPRLAQALRAEAEAAGLTVISIDTANTKLHMLHFAFFAIVRALDWDALLQRRLRMLAADAGYTWPDTAGPVPLPVTLNALAQHNDVPPTTLRTRVERQVARAVWGDVGLAQDFRRAMTALLDARLAGDADEAAGAVHAWLRGELPSLRTVKSAQIGARIGRHNARAMLVSLCHWLRGCGHPGLLVLLDIRRLSRERREVADGLAYSPAAVMDCYEVIRQVIDDAEHLQGLFLAVLADHRLMDDDSKRALAQYAALKMRVVDDVRPDGQDNPLSPLVVLAA